MSAIDIIKIYEKIRRHNRIKDNTVDKKYVVIYDSHNNTLIENTILYFIKLKYALLKKVDSYTGCHIYKITDGYRLNHYLEELDCSLEVFDLDTINLVVTEIEETFLMLYKSKNFNLTVSNNNDYPEKWSVNCDLFMRGLIQFCILSLLNDYNYDESELYKITENIEKYYPLILRHNTNENVYDTRDYIDSLVDETLKIS